MGPVMAVMNIIWVPVIILLELRFQQFALTILLLQHFLVNILHTFILYRMKSKTSLKILFKFNRIYEFTTYYFFKAVFDGFVKDGLPFKRTQKGGKTKKNK